MRNKKTMYLSIPAALIITVSLFAATEVRSSSWPYEKSDLAPDPAVEYRMLKNGFRYVLMENSRPADRVSMHLVVLAGSMNETEGQEGIAHFLEHMLFNGSTHFKPGELVKYFQSIGMDFGPDANARTGFFETVYDILLPKSDSKSIADGLLVMNDYARGALLLPDEVERERGVVLAEKRTRDSVYHRTYEATIKFELPGTRMADRLPIGKEETLKKFKAGDFRKFYDDWYQSGNMILVMVGDFDSKTVAPLIEKEFGGMAAIVPDGPGYEPDRIVHKGLKPFYHYESEAGNTRIGIEVVKNYERGTDSFSTQKKLRISRIADSIVRNRLDELLKKPGSPVTSAYASSGIYLRHARYAEIGAECNPENWEAALSLVERTLRQALLHGFTESEVERVKKEALSNLDNAVKKAPTRESRRLAGRIIRSLAKRVVFQSPGQEKEMFAPVIKSLTPETVHKVFRENWDANHRLVLVTGNAQIPGENQEKEIAGKYNKSTAQSVAAPEERKPVVFPYLPKPEKKEKPAELKEIADLGIVQVDFENGVRLNLKQTDFKANEVLVDLNIGEGRSVEPPDAPGLAELCEAVINESGLGSLDKDEIERALAGKNTNVWFGVGESEFTFSGSTVSDHTETLFQLLHAHIMDPGYKEEAFRLEMERFAQEYGELSRTIDGAFVLHVRSFLAGGDGRFGLPPREVFEKLTLDQARAWLDPVLANERIEISVVGDFDREKVIDLASLYFGSLPERKGVPQKLQKKIIFPSGKSLELGVETKIDKGTVVVAYPSDDMWDIGLTRRLSALCGVFSERMRETVREKLGASYSQYAFNRPGQAYEGYGVLQAKAHVDPQQTEKILAELRKIGAELCEKGVTPDELKRTVDPMITGIKDMLRENDYWMRVLSGSVKHPEQIEWSRTILNDYRSITAEELTKLARRFLDGEKAATVIIAPVRKKADRDQKS